MERVVGIEPTPSAWQAEGVPLDYTRVVGKVGLEPTSYGGRQIYSLLD